MRPDRGELPGQGTRGGCRVDPGGTEEEGALDTMTDDVDAADIGIARQRVADLGKAVAAGIEHHDDTLGAERLDEPLIVADRGVDEDEALSASILQGGVLQGGVRRCRDHGLAHDHALEPGRQALLIETEVVPARDEGDGQRGVDRRSCRWRGGSLRSGQFDQHVAAAKHGALRRYGIDRGHDRRAIEHHARLERHETGTAARAPQGESRLAYSVRDHSIVTHKTSG